MRTGTNTSDNQDLSENKTFPHQKNVAKRIVFKLKSDDFESKAEPL